MVSSCAQKGIYYEPDRISTRYGWKGGAAHTVTQQNRDGRGDKRFREPGFNFPTLWNSEPKSIVKDGFAVANAQKDVNKMITNGDVFSKKRGNISISGAEKYVYNSYSSGTSGFDMIKEAKKILDLEKKASTNKEKYSSTLSELSHTLDLQYKSRCISRLDYIISLYRSIIKGLNSDVSKDKDCRIFSQYKDLNFSYRAFDLCPQLRDCIIKHHKDIININPMIWPCFVLTDGKEHNPNDYVFEYLFGDPSKVDDPHIREIIFGKPEDYYIPGCKKINQFISKDVSRKDILKKYHVFDAESKWYMVTMGDSKVYIEIGHNGTRMDICSLINPANGICIVRS